MIRFLRNHPSALLWETILNETDYPEYFARNQLAAAREECGDLPAWCACDWYARYAENYPVNYTADKSRGKPMFVREYGDAYMEQYGPMRTMRRVRRGENTGFYPGGERAMLRSAQERFEAYAKLRAEPALSGAAVWAAIDHNRGYNPTEAAVGMVDFLRLPKFWYYLFDAQQEAADAGARCFIANYNTPDSPRDVTVYTNAEEVRLCINGRTVGEKRTGGIPGIHPPVVFDNVPFEPGELRAEALIGGKVVARHTVVTPSIPARLMLKPHFCGVETWTADGADLLLVHVSVTDDEGNVVCNAEPDVTFTLEGGAEIVGARETWVSADKVRLEAGRSGVLLRAGLCPGRVVLHATSDGLEPASVSLMLRSDKRMYLPCEEYASAEKTPVYDCDARERFSVPESESKRPSSCWDAAAGKSAEAPPVRTDTARRTRTVRRWATRGLPRTKLCHSGGASIWAACTTYTEF